MTLEDAVEQAYELVVQAAERVSRLLQTGKSINI
jgi:hypothetical protein